MSGSPSSYARIVVAFFALLQGSGQWAHLATWTPSALLTAQSSSRVAVRVTPDRRFRSSDRRPILL